MTTPDEATEAPVDPGTEIAGDSQPPAPPRRLWPATLGVLALALAILIPTVGDIGLTWDEPAYRYSQLMSSQWWEQAAHVRSWEDLRALLDPDALLFYWPYGRHGINFHPPLAGQLNLATYTLLGGIMKDIPARRMAPVIELAMTAAIGFHFLARRYGMLVGLVMAGSLVLMPRVYGQAHLIDTDTPGLFLWAAASIALWNGLHEERGRRWRVLLGILVGLAFVEKMSAVTMVLPLFLWLAASRSSRAFVGPGARLAWIDGLVTAGPMLIALGLAFLEIQSLQRQLPPPGSTDLFLHRPASDLPGWILAVPLVVWLIRRLLGFAFPRHALWGAERPGLETWTAALAFGPVVAWLGNPAWWRETLPRLAHYYALNTNRQGALPDIQIIYFGEVFEYSLPWHNGWVLIAITVPLTILVVAAIGLVWGLLQARRDRLPLYVLLHFMTLPALRMLRVPAHDGVRLLLPSFFFLAAFSGCGAEALSRLVHRLARVPLRLAGPATMAAVLIPAGVAVASIHPYELSYYNEILGGPRGAWHRGFELTYWLDAFNGPVVKELNARLPTRAELDDPNELTNPMTWQELQGLGELRKDLILGRDVRTQGAGVYGRIGYAWLHTQDSKATPFSRFLFAMKPWYASEPSSLGGLRVATVADPIGVSRAWALELLVDAPDPDPIPPPKPRVGRLIANEAVLRWAREDPAGLEAAAKKLEADGIGSADPHASRLMNLMTVHPEAKHAKIRRFLLNRLLKTRPVALVEGVRILAAHPEAVVEVMTRYAYTDPEWIGGYLDRDLAAGE
ncbi:glycosyltransferase family 39 protein [Aquisphaera insulae]|uniref:glycosyltransferase family 39 protein n=1 Tax=Aquisphaera insulae TaxID=2712864 RepID=UPI0013EA5643|nr:glycosyltransferase family 39 protein [Aquisphaera insulae]